MTAPQGPSPTSGGPAPYPDWDELTADIGDRIRAERHARGWSQTQLAQHAGATRAQVHNLEDGNIVFRTFLAACWALRVEPAHILSDGWVLPEPARERLRLTPMQTRVLAAAVSGDRLPVVAARLGTTRQVVAARLSEAYRLLGVSHLPVADRRAAAVQAAREHGLLSNAA